MFNIKIYIDHILTIGASRPGQMLYSILAGSLGTIILVLFLTGLSLTLAVGDILPVIIGFNSALTGYMVLEKTRDGFIHKRVVAMGSGAAVVFITSAILNIMFFRGTGILLIGIGQLLTLLVVGIVTSSLGGMLAIKYFRLNQ
jgi:hypothetical protein